MGTMGDGNMTDERTLGNFHLEEILTGDETIDNSLIGLWVEGQIIAMIRIYANERGGHRIQVEQLVHYTNGGDKDNG